MKKTIFSILMLGFSLNANAWQPVSSSPGVTINRNATERSKSFSVLFTNDSSVKASLAPTVPVGSGYKVVLDRCKNIAAGATCPVTVSFDGTKTPGAAAPGQLVSATLSGNGASILLSSFVIKTSPAEIKTATVSPQAPAVTFTAGQRSKIIEFTVSNTGNIALLPQVSASGAIIAVNRCKVSLPSQKSCSVFLSVPNQSGSPQLTVASSGMASPALAWVSVTPSGGGSPQPTPTPVIGSYALVWGFKSPNPCSTFEPIMVAASIVCQNSTTMEIAADASICPISQEIVDAVLASPRPPDQLLAPLGQCEVPTVEYYYTETDPRINSCDTPQWGVVELKCRRISTQAELALSACAGEQQPPNPGPSILFAPGTECVASTFDPTFSFASVDLDSTNYMAAPPERKYTVKGSFNKSVVVIGQNLADFVEIENGHVEGSMNVQEDGEFYFTLVPDIDAGDTNITVKLLANYVKDSSSTAKNADSSLFTIKSHTVTVNPPPGVYNSHYVIRDPLSGEATTIYTSNNAATFRVFRHQRLIIEWYSDNGMHIYGNAVWVGGNFNPPTFTPINDPHVMWIILDGDVVMEDKVLDYVSINYSF